MTPTPDATETKIRATLRAVAQTVTESPLPASPPPTEPVRSRGRRRRKWSLVAGAVVAVPLTLTAAAYLRTGPEYVDAIPENTIIVQGRVDGDRYLLVETRRTECGKTTTGVELVEEDENLLGSEWNTVGEQYGEYGDSECDFDTSRYLSNPALYNDSGTVVGDSFVWMWAVHPDVTAVRVTTGDSSTDLRVHRVDGAGYALYEIPEDVNDYTAELLIGDDVVPGSLERQRVPVP